MHATCLCDFAISESQDTTTHIIPLGFGKYFGSDHDAHCLGLRSGTPETTRLQPENEVSKCLCTVLISGYALSTYLNSKDAFVPPNPKLFVIAAFTFAGVASVT